MQPAKKWEQTGKGVQLRVTTLGASGGGGGITLPVWNQGVGCPGGDNEGLALKLGVRWEFGRGWGGGRGATAEVACEARQTSSASDPSCWGRGGRRKRKRRQQMEK